MSEDARASGERRVTATREDVDREIRALRDLLTMLIEGNDKRYEQRFNSSQLAVDAALNAAKEAVTKAETAAEKRFEGLNELRGVVEDQQRNLMPRPEGELRFKAQDTRIEAVEKSMIERSGAKVGSKETIAWIAAAVAALAAITAIAWRIGGA